MFIAGIQVDINQLSSSTIIIFMIAQFFRRVTQSRSLGYCFATSAVKDQHNYYSVLEVAQGATQNAIRAAYAQLTQGLNPKADTAKFNQLNQAFVILTDNKTRDAYDSLLKVRKRYYLSPEEDNVPATKSYLSQRKDNKLQELKKKINIDQFGRYKGGLPRKLGELRGKSKAQAGVMHRPSEIEEQLDSFPQFNNVTTQKAESFKNFHQDERQARQMKWPWTTFEVDYEYFTFRTFRKQYWPKIQFLVLFFYILPTLYYAVIKYQKQQGVKGLKAKSQKSQAPHSA